MKRKLFKLAPALLILTLITGHATGAKSMTDVKQATTEQNVKNTISFVEQSTLSKLKGVSNIFHYYGKDKLVIGINEQAGKLGAPKENEDLTKYYRQKYGSVYTVNISDSKVTSIKDNDGMLNSLDLEFGAGYSPDGKYADYVKNDKSYVLDIQKGVSKEYSNINMNYAPKMYGNWSNDSNSIIKYGNRCFFIFDNTGTLKNTIKLNDNVNYVSGADFYSKDGKDIHFIGRMHENNSMKAGLYKLNVDTESITPIINLDYLVKEKIKNPGTDPVEHKGEYIEIHKQSDIFSYKILSNGNIIVDALLDSKLGLYLYDVKTNKLNLLTNYEGGLNFSVSPDESKIVYSITTPIYDNNNSQKDTMEGGSTNVKPLENKSNIYVANFKDNKLDDITYITKDQFAIAYKWSEDSKKLILYSGSNINHITFK
ncbi:hypothetical protein PV797_20505 [Clostridiaceae bacterium M8S5]|nr:hypothetical protein PV797_20505 [Clostridiaceae bacterium M8S5]